MNLLPTIFLALGVGVAVTILAAIYVWGYVKWFKWNYKLQMDADDPGPHFALAVYIAFWAAIFWPIFEAGFWAWKLFCFLATRFRKPQHTV